MEERKVEERIMKDLIHILREDNHSLVIFKNAISTYDGRGVSDLFRLLDKQPEEFEGAQLADKVVGKGAAALMALGKVKEIYAEVISEPALELLEQEGIRVSYGKLVPHIINREGTGLCPVETRCLPCKTLKECLTQINIFMTEMQQGKNK